MSKPKPNSCRPWLIVACVLAGLMFPRPAAATIVVDPQTLYQQMKDAYDKGTAQGWNFRSQETYLSTIFNAGRAYSLQRPDDPNYGVIATLVVQIGGGLHYNPLTNHDAAAWYVREAATWVIKNSQDASLVKEAQAILERVNSEDDPERLVRLADVDATANLQQYPRDVDAQLEQVEADWRGWILTHDTSWRSLALERAAQPAFPIANLPTTYGNDLITAANSAAGVDGYTAGDRKNGQTIVERLKDVDPMRVIASVKAVPHDVYLSTLAPADEYFGPLGMSILGIENELKHINFMLDYKYGNRESNDTAIVAQSIDDMHKVYPRDRDLPMLLAWCYDTAERMDDATAKSTAAHLRSILTVEYQDSPEARKVLNRAGT